MDVGRAMETYVRGAGEATGFKCFLNENHQNVHGLSTPHVRVALYTFAISQIRRKHQLLTGLHSDSILIREQAHVNSYLV